MFAYPFFDAVDDDGRVLPGEPAKECRNSHLSKSLKVFVIKLKTLKLLFFSNY